MKIALPEKVLLLHQHVDVPYSLVVTYINLSMAGELCLRDGKNAAFVHVHYLSPLYAGMENVTPCARIGLKLFLIG